MSAAVPATSGAEKLVPIDALKASEYAAPGGPTTGVVVPVFVVVRIGYRHAPVFVTQFPAGAAIEISGPSSE